jgi:NADP-dependent 3-hydroxy acid dehydrogenase YdfG
VAPERYRPAADHAAIAAGYYENGAKVYITGRRKEVLDATAEELKKLGGSGSIITYAS